MTSTNPLSDEMAFSRIAPVLRGQHRLETALRQLLRDGHAFDSAVFVLTEPGMLPLSYEFTRTFDLPGTLDPGAPLQYSKAARTVHAWLRWVADDFGGRHLIRMMYDGIPAPQEIIVDGERGGRLQMAGMLRRAGIGAGRRRLLEAVDACIETMTGARGLSQARANRIWLEQLLAVTPTPDSSGHVSLHAMAQGAARLVEELCRDAYPGEELALRRIAEMMKQRLSAPDAQLAAADAARQLATMLRSEHYPMVLRAPGSDAMATTGPLPGHLHITTRTDTAGLLRANVYAIDGGGDLASFSPDGPAEFAPGPPYLSLGDWWLALCATQETSMLTDALHAWNPLLKEGARAEAARAAAEPTAWDGLCGPDCLSRPADSFHDRAVRLFSRCAFAFFLEHILEVIEPAPWKQERETGEAFGALPQDTGEADAAPLPPSLRRSFAEAVDAGYFPRTEDTAACSACPLKSVCTTSSERIPELHHLLNAMRILTDPENPIPVVAFLRGPFCGADDRALLDYHRAGGQFAFNARAIPGMDERIARGLQYIKDTVRLVRSNPPGTVIASMIERLSLHAVIACSPSGWSGVAALRELFALVQHWSTTGDSIPEIVEKLEGVFAQGFFPSPAAVDRGSRMHAAIGDSAQHERTAIPDPGQMEARIRAQFDSARLPSAV